MNNLPHMLLSEDDYHEKPSSDMSNKQTKFIDRSYHGEHSSLMSSRTSTDENSDRSSKAIALRFGCHETKSRTCATRKRVWWPVRVVRLLTCFEGQVVESGRIVSGAGTEEIWMLRVDGDTGNFLDRCMSM